VAPAGMMSWKHSSRPLLLESRTCAPPAELATERRRPVGIASTITLVGLSESEERVGGEEAQAPPSARQF